MENIWDLEKTQRLFSLVEQSGRRGESLSSAFAKMARETGISEGSVRNYYYSQARLFKIMPELAANMGIIPSGRRSKPFVTFTKEQSEKIIRLTLTEKAMGKSVRQVLWDLAGGDKTVALRLQNKYRSLLVHHKALVEEVTAKLSKEGISYYDPYAKAVISPESRSGLSVMLEKIEALTSTEKEALLRKILL